MPAARTTTGGPAQRGGGLQLTRAADYAVRALIHLAQQPSRARLSQADIAAAIDAPAPFVGKVMQQLAVAGLVTSQRGNGGGFALDPAAAGATMLDAVTAIEGPLALNTCLSTDEPCGRSAFCPAHCVWHEAQARVVEVLRSATIGALAARPVGAGVGTCPAAAPSPTPRPRRARRLGAASRTRTAPPARSGSTGGQHTTIEPQPGGEA